MSPATPAAQKSELLERSGFAHAFFTRRGGVSPAPWDSFNMATSVGDAEAHVRENLARAAASLGVDPARLYVVSQVHGTLVVVVDGSETPAEVGRRQGDLVLSRTARVACGVRSADCVPVLLGDLMSGAVVAVHSGWRGTASDAAGAGVAALAALGAEPRNIVAAIGPHIEACCFEVGEDVAAELARASSLEERAVLRSAEKPRPRVDLRSIVRAQLAASGVTSIDDVRGCTVCDAATFFSHRRDAAKSGRMLSAIVARGPV